MGRRVFRVIYEGTNDLMSDPTEIVIAQTLKQNNAHRRLTVEVTECEDLPPFEAQGLGVKLGKT